MWGWLVWVGCRSAAPPAVEARTEVPPPAPVATVVSAYGFTVSDLDASLEFFVDTLGAVHHGTETVSGPAFAALTGLTEPSARRAALSVGDQNVVLTDYDVDGAGAEVRPSNTTAFQHIALVTRDIDTAYANVVDAGAQPISVGGPQTIPLDNPAAGGIRAVYFRDADAHALELIAYPKGKGAEAWHAQEGPLVLGIDHSAIGVGNTERSLGFYRDVLGLAVRGTSRNQGAEQEALSGVEGAVVAITGLGGPTGPGVEFLDYQAPGVEEVAPALPDGLGFWHTTLLVDDLDAVWAKVTEAGVTTVSTGIGDCGLCLAGGRGAMVRDPDGHAVLLEERAR